MTDNTSPVANGNRHPPQQFVDDSLSDLDTPVWGAAAIAELLNCSERRAYWLLERGHIPAEKIGHHWVTTRRRACARIEGRA
jgi:hypothetical protein